MSTDDNETDCSIALSEVYLYLDLECSEDRRQLIQKHLDECTGCLREFGIEQDVKALVNRCCGDERAPSELRDRLRFKLDQLEVQTETREHQP
ncbi:mycothiol system anti-sigma-R factor [Actinoplanes lutulentus]|uniref:Mycothiol system anti-sigma-R factor n=1 Tax=Actinoplanes lutulentus TaxID=1287878 RepID=A0A327Z9D4_9ACTN|nr:mycothiol system anti-sigma-R factor [Actinoplanes lutulentus]MBB2946182.1 mycothiol system anti-sigma-R factor [Actinoplanes lutulentus]RAK32871.1 mycothiol system anti-sigma-R factor [Actinoplanes lutulentus]